MGSPKTQTVTQKTELDPVLQAHLYGGTLPESARTGILPAYFQPGGSLEGARGSVEQLYMSDGGEVKYANGGITAAPAVLPPSDGNILSLAEQAYQLTAGTDLGAQLPSYQVAGQAPSQQMAYGLAQQGIGSYQPYLQQAAQTTGAGVGALGGAAQGVQQAMAGALPFQQAAAGLTGQGAMAATGSAGSYDPTSYQAFMNPYTQDVISAAESDAARQAAMLGQQIGASAVGAGAYGGGREAVARSEAARNLADQLSRTTSQLRAQGYQTAQQQAQQAFESQQQRQMGVAGLLGQLGAQMGGLGTTYGQLGLGAAGQMAGIAGGLGSLAQQTAGLGQMGQQMGLQDINTLLTTGGQQQQYQQALLDAARMNEYQRVMAPYQQTAFRADVLSGSPTGVTSTMTQPGPSPLSQGIGLLTALGGLGGMF